MDKSIVWYLDLGMVGRTVIGRVAQQPVEGSTGMGQVKQVGKWAATGMREDWNDTPLGSNHSTRTDAMRAVADWYADNEGKASV